MSFKVEGFNSEENDGNEIANPKEYREIVGSQIYAMTCTRPDISWIVSKPSQTLASPKIENLVAGCKQWSEVPKGDQ